MGSLPIYERQSKATPHPAEMDIYLVYKTGIEREDSSSDEGTDSFGEYGIYDNGEPWGYKALTLKQIIGGKPGGMFPSQLAWVRPGM